jgi:hypothetical protein
MVPLQLAAQSSPETYVTVVPLVDAEPSKVLVPKTKAEGPVSSV